MSDFTDSLYLSPELVYLDLEKNDREMILTTMAENLYKEDIVNENFVKAILDREKAYPTGLLCEEVGVAIPHADSEYVKRQAISIARLKEPVEFIQMGTDDQKVAVSLIFMLAIKQEKEQVHLLSSLMSIFLEKEYLKRLIECESKEELISSFNALINRKEGS